MEIIQVTQDLIANKITREMAVIKLFKMDLATNEYKFAKAVAKLARKLPRMSFAEESNEMELCSRHVDPFLSGLKTFCAGVLTSVSPNDKACNGSQVLGLREAKLAHQASNGYMICRDLLRISFFCKNALDMQTMMGVMGLQVIGRTVTVYSLVLPSSGLYVVYELAKVKIPDCLDDLPKLIMDISNVLLVFDVFDRFCIPSVDSPHSERQRPTISSSNFNKLFSASQNRKRSCHLKHLHN
ncbi:hypothetical protein G6F46_000153 [Rhizopus delemar]|uniref:Uncharacterized protein n=2 Tax=Rhizopus TaxID=4842 RepID=A0A9P6ZD70_9FUNG|nr:hypothetical protein G6F55_008160 [Rhizopus delemar]KAG1553624.1 hypothetical protein G6F51_000469 [Rhizopus arrhizus]KAG1504474.1 hypothetical protein G6F54_000965 [Rhizopus delemar]KAG1516359.1 hypothetical protein G6F52_009464 [Rhizopus delemar]KAG1518098.1 hypothetical protein G6F53_000850 [Rhizopus delemar]